MQVRDVWRFLMASFVSFLPCTGQSSVHTQLSFMQILVPGGSVEWSSQKAANSVLSMMLRGLQTARGKPAKGIVAKEIAAIAPKFVGVCKKAPRAMKGKLIISADKGPFQRCLSSVLSKLRCERAPIVVGHDFQLPIERSFARAKARARTIVNMTTSDLTKEQIGEIFRKSWLWANDLSSVRAEIRKMPTVWRLIRDNDGEYVTKAMLEAELKRMEGQEQ